MTVYIYTRVSTRDQIEGTSLAEQERVCRGVALTMTEGEPVVFSDPAVSGSLPLAERPQGGEMLSRLTPGTTVIAFDIDRMFRDAADALTMVKELQQKGVDLVFTKLGLDPVTKNGTAKLIFGVLASCAEWERQKITDRMTQGRRAKASQGGYTGGPVPFGYRKVGDGRTATLEPVEKEQEAIELAKKLRRKGLSSRAIAMKLKMQLGVVVSHVTVNRIAPAKTK